MFLGASLDPDYFSSTVNLFIALAPITALDTPSSLEGSNSFPAEWPEFEYLAYRLGAYDLFNLNWMEETAVQTLCGHFGDFCDNLLHRVAGGNDQIDNMDRLTVFLKDYPAGSGYKNTIFYMQSGEHPNVWRRYNHGAILNMERYG